MNQPTGLTAEKLREIFKYQSELFEIADKLEDFIITNSQSPLKALTALVLVQANIATYLNTEILERLEPHNRLSRALHLFSSNHFRHAVNLSKRLESLDDKDQKLRTVLTHIFMGTIKVMNCDNPKETIEPGELKTDHEPSGFTDVETLLKEISLP